MIFQRRITYSLIGSFIGLIITILAPIIPCKTAPLVPNPTFKWTLCTLNPDKFLLSNSITKYFGYTESLTQSFFITIILIFLVVLAIFSLAANTKN